MRVWSYKTGHIEISLQNWWKHNSYQDFKVVIIDGSVRVLGGVLNINLVIFNLSFTVSIWR